ncbi:MAG: heparin lyase I family protein [Burkholderiales bacterium]
MLKRANAVLAAFVLAAALWVPQQPAAAQLFCTFATSPNDCGFIEQSKVSGRASIAAFGRDGATSVRLHTEPGDDDVAASGDMERDDLYLAVPGTADPLVFNAGDEQWWAHSILFPDDFASPSWQMYVVFDFHNSAPGPFQANFHLNFAPQADITQPGNLIFRGFGGAQDMANPYGAVAVPGPVEKNVWYDFVYHVKWSPDADGVFDAWVRKGDAPVYRRVLAHRGPTLYADQGVYLKLANYHTPVCDPYPACIGADPPSSVIHDRVVRGTIWQDVVAGDTKLEGQYEENLASYDAPASWTQYGSDIGTFSGGTIRASNRTGATATLTFTGTAVTWMGVRCNVCGIASVSVDGGAATLVDLAGPGAPGSLTAEPVYSASGLTPGAHSMVISVTGTRSAASADDFVAVDGFWVLPIVSN